MTFKAFADYLQKLETTSARLEMTKVLAELFKELDKTEITVACYLLQGQLVPNYESLEFQLSVKMVLRTLGSLQHSTAISPTSDLFGWQDIQPNVAEIEKQYKQVGDIGEFTRQILEKLDTRVRKSSLSILDVYNRLVSIAKDSGSGSQDRKVAELAQLLTELDPSSAKFVVRIIMGRLRLGFSTMTLLDALSWVWHGDKRDTAALEEAYQMKADIGRLATTYLTASSAEEAVSNLNHYAVEVGIPVVPALCQRLNSATEMIEKMGEVLAEPKYDGLRIQIHINKHANPAVRAFTRNLEEVSEMFPELNQVKDLLPVESCILDSEAVGVDPVTGVILPFQETITRKRKHDVSEKAAAVPIRFYVFDCMSLNGKSLITTPLSERKDILASLITDSSLIVKAPFIETNNAQELKQFHEAQLAEGLEGAVIKQRESEYRSGRKGWRWVKIKEEEGTRGKLADTLDCVVMGYYFGRGKRSEFGIGALLVGVLDSEQQVKTIAKIGTGLTEQQLVEIKALADQQQAAQKPTPYQVHKNLIPDVWVDPELVMEVAADEITRSPVHTAGVALRFPRLIRVRSDKNWTDATTVEEVTTIAKKPTDL